MITRRYEASGVQAEFEPGSRNRVLRNLLGIVRVQDMEEAESEALGRTYEEAVEGYRPTHRFRARDIRELHQLWLGPIYSWAGKYRAVDIGKGGFQFAHAARIPTLMSELQSGALRRLTPCNGSDHAQVAEALAEVHAELILIHPFRDGNGRLARLLAVLMALQAGLPQLDFTPLAGRGKRGYVGAIHSALGRNYGPLTDFFRRSIERTVASNKR
jgi:cell filamentation protein